MLPVGTIRSNADLDAMRVHWTIVTTSHIVLTRPNELDRRAPRRRLQSQRFARHMRIDYRAPAKAAAGKFSSMESGL